MFLFTWLDWCIDILDFEKIQFFVSWAIFGVFSSAILEPNFAVEFVASLCVLIGPVEYSMVRKVFKTCQMTLNLHFDEKIIVRRCVVLKISYIEKCFDIQVITTFTAVHFVMEYLNTFWFFEHLRYSIAHKWGEYWWLFRDIWLKVEFC